MTAGIFDTHQAEAIISEMRDAAGADRGELVTRGELYRALVDSGRRHRRHPDRPAVPADLTFPAHSRTSQAPRLPGRTPGSA